MILRLLVFGMAKEIVGGSEISLECEEPATVKSLKAVLEKKYPALHAVGSYLLAVNNEYGQDDTRIDGLQDLALIPPVSGG